MNNVSKRASVIRKNTVIFVAVFLLMGSLDACWAKSFGNLNINGYYKNETAFHVHSPNEWHKIRNILNFDFEYRINNYSTAFIQLRPEYDLVFDVENDGLGDITGLRDQLQDNFFTNDDEMPLLREAWIDYNKNPFQLKAGRQIVTWGRTDGLILLDVVNPLNTYHFLTLDYADMKIPIWMLKFVYWTSLESGLEFLWIPRYVDAANAPAGSQWAFNVVELTETPGVGVYDQLRAAGSVIKTRKPGTNLRNSEVGLRWKGKIGTADYTLNYLHVWDDQMDFIPTGTWLVPQGTPDFPPGLNSEYTLKPNRLDIFGGSWSQSFNKLLGMRELVLRTEFAYYEGDTFVRADSNAIEKKDHFEVLWGFDKFVNFEPLQVGGGAPWFFSGQLVQSYMINSTGKDYLTAGLDRVDAVDNYLTLLISTSYFYERIAPDVLIVYNDDGDWWIKPKAKCQIADQIHVTLGGNFFWGEKNGFFGQLRDEDQVFMELKIGF